MQNVDVVVVIWDHIRLLELRYNCVLETTDVWKLF